MNGQKKQFNGTVLLVSADNLAAHYLGGYMSLSSAFRRCRFCLAVVDDTKTKVLTILY